MQKLGGGLFLEWLIFTYGFIGGKGATESNRIEVLDGIIIIIIIINPFTVIPELTHHALTIVQREPRVNLGLAICVYSLTVYHE